MRLVLLGPPGAGRNPGRTARQPGLARHNRAVLGLLMLLVGALVLVVGSGAATSARADLAGVRAATARPAGVHQHSELPSEATGSRADAPEPFTGNRVEV
jgi:hypothetical protein